MLCNDGSQFTQKGSFGADTSLIVILCHSSSTNNCWFYTIVPKRYIRSFKLSRAYLAHLALLCCWHMQNFNRWSYNTGSCFVLCWQWGEILYTNCLQFWKINEVQIHINLKSQTIKSQISHLTMYVLWVKCSAATNL